MAYVSKNDDVRFRRHYLNEVERDREFTKFDHPGHTIDCDPNVVLEIEKADGSTVLWAEGDRMRRGYTIDRADNSIRISKTTPVARLWVVDESAPEIRYKLPLEWKSVNEDTVKCVIPNGVSRAKLVADQYFDVLYELGRI